MKTADIELGATFTNGTQERLVLAWDDRYQGGSVVYRVVGKRGGGSLNVGDEPVMTLRQFAAWAREKVEVATPLARRCAST